MRHQSDGDLFHQKEPRSSSYETFIFVIAPIILCSTFADFLEFPENSGNVFRSELLWNTPRQENLHECQKIDKMKPVKKSQAVNWNERGLVNIKPYF